MKNFIFFLSFLFFADILIAQDNSVLALNDWYKISTDKNGVYKIDYDNLQDLGIDVTNLQTQTIRLYGNGGGMLPHLNSDFRYTDLKENPIKDHSIKIQMVFLIQMIILFFMECLQIDGFLTR